MLSLQAGSDRGTSWWRSTKCDSVILIQSIALGSFLFLLFISRWLYTTVTTVNSVLVLLPLSKLPPVSPVQWLFIISTPSVFFTAVSIPPSLVEGGECACACVCARACVCMHLSVCFHCHCKVLWDPFFFFFFLVTDEHYRNPLHYYYYITKFCWYETTFIDKVSVHRFQQWAHVHNSPNILW